MNGNDYSKGDIISIKVPEYLEKGFDPYYNLTPGKIYKGVVEDVGEQNLGIRFRDDENKPQYTSFLSPAAFNHTTDWIIVDMFIENLPKVLK